MNEIAVALPDTFIRPLVWIVLEYAELVEDYHITLWRFRADLVDLNPSIHLYHDFLSSTKFDHCCLTVLAFLTWYAPHRVKHETDRLALTPFAAQWELYVGNVSDSLHPILSFYESLVVREYLFLKRNRLPP